MSATAGAALSPLGGIALPEAADELMAFWPAFLASARHLSKAGTSLRPAVPADSDLLAVLRDATEVPMLADTARTFLEERFQPFLVEVPAFLTGYYEPVVESSPVRSDAFTAPILPRPADLVTLTPGTTDPGLPGGFSAGRRRPDGTLEPYPDRASLEAGALTTCARPLVWLRDWVEVFLIQVQGSARVRMPDGTEHRLVYAGRNGHPYTSIGRHLVETGRIAPEAMSLDLLKAWLRRHGQAPGEEGRAVMQRNRSYIFFELAPSEPGAGPIGGAGVPLTAGRSIAIDRGLWPYGLPVLIESEKALSGFGPSPLRRLFVAQDTGSAIVGPARADLFLGSGAEAGRQAGSIRHTGRFTVLLPRP